MDVGDSLCWGVDIGVGSGVDSSYGIELELDDVSEMVSYYGSINRICVSKYVKDGVDMIIDDSVGWGFDRVF